MSENQQQRDELARVIFVSDNWRLDQSEAEAEWDTLKSTKATTYAYAIANGVLAAGYREASK